MTPLDQKTKEAIPQENGANPKDLELIIRMGIKLMTEGGGLNLIKKALDESKDPAQVIGQFLATIMGKLAEETANRFQIDPRMYLMKKGFLDAMLNFIEQSLGMPEEFSDQIYGQVLEIVKAAAQSPQGGEGAPAPQEGQQPQPNQPMGGMPQ